MNRVLAVTVMCIISAPILAAPKTVTLSVPTMDCPVCPITVKKALSKVPGVSQAEVNFAKRVATVTFDDSKAGVDSLTRATKDAGYPSSLMANLK